MTMMKIAIAVSDDDQRVVGHAGQARHWLAYACEPGRPLPEPERIVLSREQLPHHFKDDGPHPLHGVSVIVTGSAGDGFIRHMATWGATVLLTGESDPRTALEKVLAGQALPDQRFDVTTTLCKLRDLFSRH
jgi:predicted Fe-Mo cluster-binding NifX family protein